MLKYASLPGCPLSKKQTLKCFPRNMDNERNTLSRILLHKINSGNRCPPPNSMCSSYIIQETMRICLPRSWITAYVNYYLSTYIIHIHTHAHTHTRARTHTHTYIYIYAFVRYTFRTGVRATRLAVTGRQLWHPYNSHFIICRKVFSPNPSNDVTLPK